jgi:hypothetical protein
MKMPMAPKQAQQVESSRPELLTLSMKPGRPPVRCMRQLVRPAQALQLRQVLQAPVLQRARQLVPGWQGLTMILRR